MPDVISQARLAYARRLARLALSDPAEFVDRARGQWEVRRDPRPFDVPQPTGGVWMDELHRLLRAAVPCSECARFPELWARACADLAHTGHAAGKLYDADRNLAEAAFAAARHLRPRVVIETGVARGLTSRFLLEGLEGRGELYSIDLPPNTPGWHDESGVAVPARLREHWHFLRGASRRLLPGLVEEHAPLRLFIHDSLHTTKNVLTELSTVWPHLEREGLVLVDDVNQNSAFASFTREVGGGADWIVAAGSKGGGLIGALMKT